MAAAILPSEAMEEGNADSGTQRPAARRFSEECRRLSRGRICLRTGFEACACTARQPVTWQATRETLIFT